MKYNYVFQRMTESNNRISVQFFYKVLLHLLLFSLFTLLFIGCFSSRVKTTDIKISPHFNSNLIILPFKGINSSYTASYTRYDVRLGAINYTIGLGENDYSNLRKTLIKSITKTGSFLHVLEGDSTSLIIGKNDLVIKFNFGPSGMDSAASGMYFTGIINCSISIFNSDNIEIIKKDLNVSIKSHLSVADAKNKAIASFVKEVAILLNSIDNQQQSIGKTSDPDHQWPKK
jgi:hypothetical protein